MSLEFLVKNLDPQTRKSLLGKETIRLLRYAFSSEDNTVLADEVSNNAILLKCGSDLVTKPSLRRSLLENNLEGKNIDELIARLDHYQSNKKDFITDFEIEDKYTHERPAESRTNSELIQPKYGECNGRMAYPHPYQKRIKDEIVGYINSLQYAKILTSMPTGAGKTVLAMEVLVDCLRNPKALVHSEELNILWIVDSKELAEQSLQSFKKSWTQRGDQPVNCIRYFDSFNSLDLNSNKFNVVFGTFDLVVSRLDSNDVLDLFNSLNLLVIDEAHMSGAESYGRVISKYEIKQSLNYKVLGLTATPFRNDDDHFITLKNNFSTHIQITDPVDKFDSPIEYLQKGEYLSNFSFEILNSERGDKNDFEYFKNLHKQVILTCENLKVNGQNTIIFAQSKSHAIALSLQLTMNNFENGLIIGETPFVERSQLLKTFANKKNPMNILVNHQILSTGIDVPMMNSIMILGNIQSPVLAMQVLGRAMRGKKNGGNPNNTIYLTKDNENKLRHFKIFEALGIK